MIQKPFYTEILWCLSSDSTIQHPEELLIQILIVLQMEPIWTVSSDTTVFPWELMEVPEKNICFP